MLIVTDSIFKVDFSLREFENFYVALASTSTLLIPLLSSTSSNGVLSVVCTIGFGGLPVLIAIPSVCEDASVVYCDEP